MARKTVAERRAAQEVSRKADIERGAVTPEGRATKRGQLESTIRSQEMHQRELPRVQARMWKLMREGASSADVRRATEDFNHNVRSRASLAKQGAGLLKDIGRGMLSPAGLAEEVAGRVASGAAKKRFVSEARKESAPSKSGLKRPRTKS